MGSHVPAAPRKIREGGYSVSGGARETTGKKETRTRTNKTGTTENLFFRTAKICSHSLAGRRYTVAREDRRKKGLRGEPQVKGAQIGEFGLTQRQDVSPPVAYKPPQDLGSVSPSVVRRKKKLNSKGPPSKEEGN